MNKIILIILISITIAQLITLYFFPPRNEANELNSPVPIEESEINIQYYYNLDPSRVALRLNENSAERFIRLEYAGNELIFSRDSFSDEPSLPIGTNGLLDRSECEYISMRTESENSLLLSGLGPNKKDIQDRIVGIYCLN